MSAVIYGHFYIVYIVLTKGSVTHSVESYGKNDVILFVSLSTCTHLLNHVKMSRYRDYGGPSANIFFIYSSLSNIHRGRIIFPEIENYSLCCYNMEKYHEPHVNVVVLINNCTS